MSIFVNDQRAHPSALKAFFDQLRAQERTDPTTRDLTRLYATSIIAYRASRKRADAVSSVRMKVVDSAGEAIDNPALLRPFTAGYKDMIRNSEITMGFFGHNLLYKRRSYNGGVYVLRWVNPAQYMLDDRLSGLKGFHITRYRNQERMPVHYIDRRDAVYMHELDFDSDYDGVAPIEVAFRHAELGVEMAETQVAFMRNRAIPAALVQPKAHANMVSERPDSEDVNRLRDMLKRLYQGAVNSGRTLVQRFQWEWIQLQMDFDKIAFTPQFDQSVEAVAMAFDIPVVILREAANYAQTREIRLDWAQNWLVPRVDWYAEQFTEQLLQDARMVSLYGPGLRCIPDLTDVPLLKEDEQATIEKTNAKLQAGYIDLYTAALRTGEKQPDDRLKGMYIWNGTPAPISELGNLWKYSQLVAPSVYNSELITDNGAQPVANPLTPPPMQAASTKSACVMLDLGGNPDLIGLQNMTRQYVGTTPVEWNAPDDFHVTLLYMPTITDEQAAALTAALEGMEIPQMNLRVGSLNTFDNLDSHAIHFRIKRNADLLDLQESLFDIATGLGIAVSAYSSPMQYKPHITMGYASTKPPARTFDSKLTVTPLALEFALEDTTLLRIDSAGAPPPPPDDPPPARTWIADDVFAEIKVAARKGASFVPDKLNTHTAAYIASLCALGIEQTVIVESAKRHHIRLTAAKAIQATRLDFEMAFEDLLARARNDEATRQQFRAKLASLLNTYGRMAYMDGFRDGGLADDEALLDDDDNETIARLLAEQSAYVSGLTDTLFKGDGVSDDLAALKPAQWFNKSIMPFYQAALASAAANSLFEWLRGNTSDSCTDCIVLEGQRRRLKVWSAKGLMPPCDKTECGGFNCDCKLVPAEGKASAGSFPILVGRKSTGDHIHEHEHAVA